MPRKLVEELTIKAASSRYKIVTKSEPTKILLYTDGMVVSGRVEGIVEREIFSNHEDDILSKIPVDTIEEKEIIHLDFRCPVYNLDSILSGYDTKNECDYISIKSVGGQGIVMYIDDEGARSSIMNIIEEWMLVFGDHSQELADEYFLDTEESIKQYEAEQLYYESKRRDIN